MMVINSATDRYSKDNTKLVTKPCNKTSALNALIVSLNNCIQFNKIVCKISFRLILSLLLLSSVIVLFSAKAVAAIEVYEFENAQQEAQYKALIEEFRCPKCQNQNLAGSDSQISKDLKRKTYDLVMAGRSDAEIREYMYERYGDFISYKPPVRPSTWILWYFPPIILILLLIWWLFRTNAKNKRKIEVPNDVNQSVPESKSLNVNSNNLNSNYLKSNDLSCENNASGNTNNNSTAKINSKSATGSQIDINANAINVKTKLNGFGENLTEKEAEKLKALLDKYDNNQ